MREAKCRWTSCEATTSMHRRPRGRGCPVAGCLDASVPAAAATAEQTRSGHSNSAPSGGRPLSRVVHYAVLNGTGIGAGERGGPHPTRARTMHDMRLLFPGSRRPVARWPLSRRFPSAFSPCSTSLGEGSSPAGQVLAAASALAGRWSGARTTSSTKSGDVTVRPYAHVPNTTDVSVRKLSGTPAALPHCGRPTTLAQHPRPPQTE